MKELVSCDRDILLESTHLDQVFALGLGDERLQLGCGKGIDKAGFGDDQQQDLGTGKNGQLVGLDEKETVSFKNG